MGKGWTDTGYFTIVSNYVLEDMSLSVKARFLYAILVRYGRWKKVGSEKYLVTWVGREKLSQLTGESGWSVSQRVRELCDKGLIERRRRTCTSSHTYICDPRSVYTATTSIPNEDIQEDDEDYQTLELAENEGAASSAPANVNVGSTQRRDVIGPMTGTAEKGPLNAPIVNPPRNSDSDKDVPVDKDIAIQSDNSRDERGATESDETLDANDTGIKEVPAKTRSRVVGDAPSRRMHNRGKERGLLARRAENKLTTKSKSKIGVPDDAVAADENNPENARALWTAFQRVMVENHSGYSVPSPTMRELANCKKLLQEHDVEDLLGLFEMVATRWPVILEKWPRLAKTALPTFYAAFTLRRELIPLVQSGKGLTSRTHRYDANAANKAPNVGWGDV